MSDLEAQASVLLREAAARQALVDRLLGRSVWNNFVRAMAVPVVADVLFLIVWSVWGQSRPELATIFIGATLFSLLWVSVAVVQVASQMRAVTTILARSSVLDDFVRGQRPL